MAALGGSVTNDSDRPKWSPFVGAAIVFSFCSIMFPNVGVAWIAALVVLGSIGFVLAGKGPPSKFLAELDAVIYDGERLIVATSLAVMSVLVFCDVVWSTSHDANPTTARAFLIGIFVLCLAGGFTTRRKTPASIGKKILSGVAAYVALLVFGAAVYVVPNGFGWSQKVALCLIVWVGLLGGSMATRQGRHIAVDAVRRVVPERLQRTFELVAGLVTVVLTSVLTVLAVIYVRANWNEWIETEMTAGIFESIPIPYWFATVPIPIGFGLMTARFLKVALRGQEKADLLESLGVANEDDENAEGEPHMTPGRGAS